MATTRAHGDTPAETFQALRKEYNRTPPVPSPLTPESRLMYIGSIYRHHTTVARKMLDLAKLHPDDPIALEALTQSVWQVNTTPWPVEMVGEDTVPEEALRIIRQRHITSEKLGPLCRRVSYGFRSEYESLLRAVVAGSPHRPVQAAARLSLAYYLVNRHQRIELCREQPEKANEFAGLYGRPYLDRLLRQKPDTVVREADSHFTGVVKKYSDVALPDEGEAGKLAAAKLYELRNLRPGRPAPDIAGLDQEGKPFKLSDYRGKVVLIDFWSYV